MGWSNSSLLTKIVNDLDPFVPGHMKASVWAKIFDEFWKEDFDVFDEVYYDTGEKPYIREALKKIEWFE